MTRLHSSRIALYITLTSAFALAACGGGSASQPTPGTGAQARTTPQVRA